MTPQERNVMEQALDLAIMHYSDNGYSALRTKVQFAIKEALAQPKRCQLCNYQYGHEIGCKNNPVDIAIEAMAQPKNPYAINA